MRGKIYRWMTQSTNSRFGARIPLTGQGGWLGQRDSLLTYSNPYCYLFSFPCTITSWRIGLRISQEPTQDTWILKPTTLLETQFENKKRRRTISSILTICTHIQVALATHIKSLQHWQSEEVTWCPDWCVQVLMVTVNSSAICDVMFGWGESMRNKDCIERQEYRENAQWSTTQMI
jgi:hypothetical protein